MNILSGNNYLDMRTRRQIYEMLRELIRGDNFRGFLPLDNIIFRTETKDLPDDIMEFLSIGYGMKSKDSLYDDRLETLEVKMDLIYKELKSLKSLLSLIEDKKEEAIIEYKRLISPIQGVLLAYCKQTIEGIALWALIDTSKISDTLSKIVQIQIELDNKYPNLYFDFQIDPLINRNELDTEDWSPLFRRER